jgi:hypothetical protein
MFKSFFAGGGGGTAYRLVCFCKNHHVPELAEQGSNKFFVRYSHRQSHCQTSGLTGGCKKVGFLYSYPANLVQKVGFMKKKCWGDEQGVKEQYFQTLCLAIFKTLGT